MEEMFIIVLLAIVAAGFIYVNVIVPRKTAKKETIDEHLSKDKLKK